MAVNDYPFAETDDTLQRQSMGNAAALLLITMILTALGLNMLYSASASNIAVAVKLFRNQLLWVMLGGMLALSAFGLGFKWFCRRTVLWLAGCALLLIWARFSKEVNGAHRWIHVAGYTFQPSELAKVAVALFVADYCSEHMRTFARWSWQIRFNIYPLAAGVGLIVLLILAGEDLGTAVLVSLVAFLTMFIGGLPWWYWLPLPLLAGMGVSFIRFCDPMRWARMTIFLDPEKYKSQGGYQLWNAFLALGSGSWFGMGLGSSRQKAGYLPEKHTDFIVAIIGEELGFVGVAAVIVLLILWGFFAFRISLAARTRKGMLLGVALTLGIVFQALINLGVVSGVFPTKGMPAPFLSYGGSNMVCSLLATGFLLSIAMDSSVPDYSEKFGAWLKSFFKRS